MCAQANNTTPPPLYEDFISSFENGCNSGILPLLLQKNQIGFGLNTSVRGAYITHRPPIQKKNLTFQNGTVEKNYQSGFFQGGGYYRPDFGTESLICQISGRLFQMIETNGIWNVTDISVPGDPNAATTGQAWMWQAEKWMIVQDGSGKLPIFFDGTVSRRSYGPSVILGVATASAPAAPPAIGSTVSLTLTAPYPGPFNVPVIFNKAFYQPVQQVLGYQAILANLYAQGGEAIPAGSQIVIKPAYIGRILFYESIQLIGSVHQTDIGIEVGSNKISLGQTLLINGLNWTVSLIYNGTYDNGLVTILPTQSYVQIQTPFPPNITASNSPQMLGLLVLDPNNNQPNIILGSVSTGFNVPNPTEALGNGIPGGMITIAMSQPYQGISNQTVWIGSEEFSLSSPPNQPASSTVLLINLTDVSTANYAFNQNILSVPEITAGRMGAYGMGRNWWSLTDGISFEAGDIVGGAAGSQANNYRDAVLKTTENDFLSGGGSFRLPGTGDVITSMVFAANLDQSLGQGPLQVGTDTTMFSCNTPVDRTTWAALTNPILTESLIGTGPLGQNSTELVNSDVFFRTVAGLGDLVLARRDFGGWGNHPISNEMTRTIQLDNQTLLQYGSSVNFDNRFITTCAPNVSAQGVFHIGLIAMNLDTISNLRTQLPPVYDGLWTGVNALQIISGKVNGSVRSFAWVFNLTANIIELWEFLPEKTDVTQDNGVTPITWTFETPVMFNKDVKKITEFIKLTNGELYLSEIVGTVSVQVQYRPDHYPCWVNWHSFQVCANPDTTVPNSQPGYRAPIGLGEPDSSVCEPGNNRPLRTGFYFQFRLVITGSCKFMGMRVEACPESRPKFAPPICDGVCNV